MSALISMPSRASLQGAFDEVQRSRRFGLGGSCSAPRLTQGSGSPGLGGSPRTDPRCFDLNYLMCCKVMLSRAALSVAPGTNATIQMEPQNSPFFKACAIAIVVVDAADETLRRVARWYSATIQGCPQLGIREVNPTDDTTFFEYTDAYDPVNRDGCACPISWGTFSNQSNSYPLELVFRNTNAAAVNIQVKLFGDEKQCAPGCTPGHDKLDGYHTHPERPRPQ